MPATLIRAIRIRIQIQIQIPQAVLKIRGARGRRSESGLFRGRSLLCAVAEAAVVARNKNLDEISEPDAGQALDPRQEHILHQDEMIKGKLEMRIIDELVSGENSCITITRHTNEMRCRIAARCYDIVDPALPVCMLYDQLGPRLFEATRPPCIRLRFAVCTRHFAPRIDERHFIMAPRAYDWPSPYIDNLIDGEEVYNARHRSGLVTNGLLRNAKADGLGFSFQRLILVSGRAGPVQITFDGCINVESVCDGSVEPPHLPQQWPVTDSYFKALVPLSPGINRLRFLFEAPDSLGGYSRNDTGTDLTVTYVPLTQNPPLHLVILAAHDSPLTVDCPPERRPGHEKIEATIAKFQLWSQLSQAFTAEQMRRNGLGRRTFALEEQSGPDSLDAFPPRHNRRRPVVHVIRSRHSLSEFRDPDVAQQNPKAARAQALHQFATEAIQSPDAPACFRNPNGSYVAVLLLDAHWDSRNRLLLGHAALGAGGPISPHPKIGVFGSHSCWSWPRTLDEVVPAFMDTSEVDERFVVNDLGNVGTAWETLNVGHGGKLGLRRENRCLD